MFLEGAAAVETRRPIKRRRRRVFLDFESFSEAQLVGPKSVGVWNYTRDLSTVATMVCWKFDGGPYQQVDLTAEPFPEELREVLLDPEIEKHAFNAAFERLMCINVLGIKTPHKGWRCTQARANLMSFSGSLGDVGRAMGLAEDKLKDKEGRRLIELFCVPQKLTRRNSLYRRDRHTDPEDWEKFLAYNMQDVVAEVEIDRHLERFFIPETEWELYEIDQVINDVGIPVNRHFVEQAQTLSDYRRYDLTDSLANLTALANPNSGAQILPWLQEEGYPFGDLKKDTVKKVLLHDAAMRKEKRFEAQHMSPIGTRALRLRQHASRTSIKKYPAILRRLSPDNRLRHAFQFVGAPRTWRWSGRGPQPHNLPRTPKMLEAVNGNAEKLEACARIIESGDYSELSMFAAEPMTALAGSIRSSFQAPEGYEFRICDLKAIETVVIAWLSGCTRVLEDFRAGLDPYRVFASILYNVPYGEVTSAQRTTCKPAVLGSWYRLGGGDLREGRRTGLWGYAENNGVDLTREEAHTHTRVFRESYPEAPDFWSKLEDAASRAVSGFETTVNGLLRFEMDGPFLKVTLPSGSPRYYYRPRVITKEFERIDEDTGEKTTYTRRVMSYMGMNQTTHQWGRIATHGGKWAENLTQALARDILALGIRRAKAIGFQIIGHVHDEIMTLAKVGNKFHTVEMLRQCMISAIEFATGLPVDAAGYAASIYRKD